MNNGIRSHLARCPQGISVLAEVEERSPRPASSSGLPSIEFLTLELSSHPRWLEQAKRVAGTTNEFLLGTYETELPPQVVVSGCDVLIPAYSVIGDTMLHAAIVHGTCDGAFVLLLIDKLKEIKNFDPVALAVSLSAERASNDSADPRS